MEDKKKTSKVTHIIYITVIVLLLGAAIGGYFYLNSVYEERYTEAVSEQKKIYTDATIEYEDALNHILKEEEDWKKELSDKQDELNKAYEKVSEVYAERQAEIDAEKNRWDALSEAEKEAEMKAIEYNKMVSFLRSTNEEYANLYVEYSKYLGEDVFNLGKEEILLYTELYNRKTEIEKDYLAKNNQ